MSQKVTNFATYRYLHSIGDWQYLVYYTDIGNYISCFTARCTLMQSAVLRLHVIRLSVRQSAHVSRLSSVTLVDQDSGVSGPHRL